MIETIGTRINDLRTERAATEALLQADPDITTARDAVRRAQDALAALEQPHRAELARLEAEEQGLRQQALAAWPKDVGKTIRGAWGQLQRRDGAATVKVHNPWAIFDALQHGHNFRAICTPTFDAKTLRNLIEADVLPRGSAEVNRADPVLAYIAPRPGATAEPGEAGEERRYRVASASEPGKTRLVTIHADGTSTCDCPGYAARQHCKHLARATTEGTPA